ncbi:MAG: CBS domain-containing protein, partial [Oligoflexales bacterium]|nr:CBS domain-containing protein [Oligoflexales bacterium]
RIKEIVHIFQEKRADCVAIIDEARRPIGVFTDRDVITKVIKDPEGLSKPISEFMIKKPVCILKSDPIAKAIAFMRVGNFRHLLIVDQSGAINQILTVKDVINFISDNIDYSS